MQTALFVFYEHIPYAEQVATASTRFFKDFEDFAREFFLRRREHARGHVACVRKIVSVQVFSSLATEYEASLSGFLAAFKAKVCSAVRVATRLPFTNNAVSSALNTGLSFVLSV